jgi:broad specificity phosphatase PhoE
MEIVLVRHGQPEWVRDGLNVDNPPLTEVGRRQAEAMAAHLATERFDEVVVSPLVRARQTAAPLYSRLARDESIDEWLEEIRNPIWHGTPAEKAEEAYREERQRPASERWRGLDHLGGEHVGEFVARIRQGCGLFLAERGVEPVDGDLPVWSIKEPERRIALVAHAGTNAVVICHLLGLAPTPWEWERFVLNHASVTRLVSLELGDGHTFALSKLSDVEFLAPGDRTF